MYMFDHIKLNGGTKSTKVNFVSCFLILPYNVMFKFKYSPMVDQRHHAYEVMRWKIYGVKIQIIRANKQNHLLINEILVEEFLVIAYIAFVKIVLVLAKSDRP